MSIAQNLQRITDEISNASVALEIVAVSKTFGTGAIEEAVAAGQTVFGENYVQEGVEKITYFRTHHPELKLTWHFIGALQSNKTRLVSEHFDWVQSVNREKIARRLSEQRPENLPDLNVLIEVNIDAEESKSGVLPADVDGLLYAIASMPRIRVRGLMCIPSPKATGIEKVKSFEAMAALMKELNAKGFRLDVLSMGMSSDYLLAAGAGATMIRVGSAIFGQRDYGKERK